MSEQLKVVDYDTQLNYNSNMNLHIEKKDAGESFLWINDNGLRFSDSKNDYGLSSVDEHAVGRLSECLDAVLRDEWEAHGYNEKVFAKVVAKCLQKVESSRLDTLNDETIFVCPSAMRELLKEEELNTANNWIGKYLDIEV